MGFENNFNGKYFHHHFYFKTGVSRNCLSLGYSERDISSVRVFVKIMGHNDFSLDLEMILFENVDQTFQRILNSGTSF